MSDVAPSEKKIRIFLSYAYADFGPARKIRNLLFLRLNLPVFLREDLIKGQQYRQKLRRELEHADIFVALLTPASISDSELLQETGAAWALEKQVVPIVTRRNVLNSFPVALDPQLTIQINYLDRLDEPENADKFIQPFEKALAASHLSVARTA